MVEGKGKPEAVNLERDDPITSPGAARVRASAQPGPEDREGISGERTVGVGTGHGTLSEHASADEESRAFRVVPEEANMARHPSGAGYHPMQDQGNKNNKDLNKNTENEQSVDRKQGDTQFQGGRENRQGQQGMGGSQLGGQSQGQPNRGQQQGQPNRGQQQGRQDRPQQGGQQGSQYGQQKGQAKPTSGIGSDVEEEEE